MYFKIALGNVRKSFKDYSIYFLTLTLGVCIFYAFNSIGDQKAFLEMGKNQAEYIKFLQSIISGVSVFISFILGGLIVYANNFLVKKRKKELGLYMTLGMGKNKISKILTYETILVGIISLLVGLGIGIIVSQGISAFSAKLFEIPLSNYKFLFSMGAMVKTMEYFGIIFVLVMIFNSIVISKYKLIDMLNANKKSENIKVKNPIIIFSIFLMSLILLAAAYFVVIKIGLRPDLKTFWVTIILGILGTLLLIFSLAGFTLYMVQKNKNIYLKNLNVFVLRQINNKINTNFVSMTVICLMLFLTISVLSTGLSFKNALSSDLEETTPFDASATLYIDNNSKVTSVKESLNLAGFKFNSSDKVVYYNEYELKDTDFYNVFNDNINDTKKVNKNSGHRYGITTIDITSYNKIRNLKGEKEINLNNNEILLSSNSDKVIPVLKSIVEKKSEITINNKKYKVANSSLIGKDKVITGSLESSGMKSNDLTLIVPDNVVTNLEKISSKVNINYGKDKKVENERVENIFEKYISGKLDTEKIGYVSGYTRSMIYEKSNVMSSLILFLVIYLGIIFLISSTAVLALQQLSDGSDSVERYKSLRRIGVPQKMINKSIFTQVSIYFGLPLVIALVHSVVAIKVINEFVSKINKVDIVSSSLITVLIMVIVYGGYFYATYSGYKSIVKNALKQK
ncbi:ABC transporter permease [Clostridium sp.]|uniref:FtsX-like permease family protein n=1 Tax=Clostridium sp. TaxID=1506 RepID=UPI0026081BEF|nr:ABC transporter permease [Clostridium sp.]